MNVSAVRSTLDEIHLWRDMYRLEMACQIVHDSLHVRPGWTDEYLLSIAGVPVGYGSIVLVGPWQGQPTVYEFYVVPHERLRLFDLFEALLDASGAVSINMQSNDALGSAMLFSFASPITSEAILFHDRQRTSLAPAGAVFRQASPTEAPDVPSNQRKWRAVVEVDGQVAASGGVMFHYNRPYGDIYMDVDERFRRRGLGSFIVQELKRLCYEQGHVPAARCSPANIASRRTLQKAGFVPCGNILVGAVPGRDGRRDGS